MNQTQMGKPSPADPSSAMLRKRALIIFLAMVLVVTTAWGALVVLYAGPATAVWARASLATVYAVGSLAALAWLRPLRRALAVWGVGLFAILIWWSTLRPSNDGDWQQDVAKLSWAEVQGDALTVHNVRNFDYRSDTEFTPRFEDRVYDLSKLRGFDIFLSYWGSRVIAHTIVSWDFADSPPLAISIETRKQKGQEYSAIEGFFRQYEIIYVAADERDIVRVRTNYRGEDVYLYKIKATPEQARLLLMDYVATMNALDDAPEFYNALVDNCTTNIYQHVKNVLEDPPRVDWRLLANGYGDEMLYENGNIDTRLPFEELRARSHINGRAKSLDRDPYFSQGIREGLPDPRSSTKESAEKHRVLVDISRMPVHSSVRRRTVPNIEAFLYVSRLAALDVADQAAGDRADRGFLPPFAVLHALNTQRRSL